MVRTSSRYLRDLGIFTPQATTAMKVSAQKIAESLGGILKILGVSIPKLVLSISDSATGAARSSAVLIEVSANCFNRHRRTTSVNDDLLKGRLCFFYVRRPTIKPAEPRFGPCYHRRQWL